MSLNVGDLHPSFVQIIPKWLPDKSKSASGKANQIFREISKFYCFYFRFNRYNDYYDSDGDWGWFTVNIDEDKEQFYNLQIPLTTDDWYDSLNTIGMPSIN